MAATGRFDRVGQDSERPQTPPEVPETGQARSQATPGPWLVDAGDNVYAVPYYKPRPFTALDGTHYPDHMDGVVALVYGCGPGVNQEANARLIAAAPTMLAAIKDFLGPNGDGITASREAAESHLLNLRAAVAKAESR